MWRSVNPEPTADPGDSYNNPPEEPVDVGSSGPDPQFEVKSDPDAGKWKAKEADVGITMAGFSIVNGTHKVTVSFFATTPGAQLVAMGSNEARLFAKSIMDWADYCDGVADGKKA